MRDHRAEAAAADKSHPERWPAFVAAIRAAVADMYPGQQFIAFSEISKVVPKNSRSYYHGRLMDEHPDLAKYIRQRNTPVRRPYMPAAAVGEPLQPWIVATSLHEEARVLIRLAVEAEEAAALGDDAYFIRARQVVERLTHEIEQISQVIEDPVRRREVASK